MLTHDKGYYHSYIEKVLMPDYPTLIPETSLQGTDIQYEGMAGCGKGQGQTPGPPQRRAGQVQARR